MSFAARTERRKLRNRSQVRNNAQGRPRLNIYRSNQYIYAQIIDDNSGVTLAAANSKVIAVEGDKSAAAAAVGKAIAEAALAKGVQKVVFDRGQYKYHGRVKALAEAAREGGLDF